MRDLFDDMRREENKEYLWRMIWKYAPLVLTLTFIGVIGLHTYLSWEKTQQNTQWHWSQVYDEACDLIEKGDVENGKKKFSEIIQSPDSKGYALLAYTYHTALSFEEMHTHSKKLPSPEIFLKSLESLMKENGGSSTHPFIIFLQNAFIFKTWGEIPDWTLNEDVLIYRWSPENVWMGFIKTLAALNPKAAETWDLKDQCADGWLESYHVI
jgi:hypothetical protein